MRKYKYVGPHDEVELNDLQGGVVGLVKRNHTIEVHDPEVADSLDAQADWQHVPARKPAAKRPAAKRPSKSRAKAGSKPVDDNAGDAGNTEE